jgi:prepilin-type N-terminal cleavage/methylation domain-containing protein
MRLRQCAAAARRRLAAEHGYSLSEMLVVLAILGIVLGALAQLFVSGSTAQVDMTRRFEAQQNTRLALDKLRREIHCASEAKAADGTLLAPATAYSTIRFTLPSYCPTNPTVSAVSRVTAYATWCTAPVSGSPNRYQLWRYVTTNPLVFVGAGCGSTITGAPKQQWADYLKLASATSAFPEYTAAPGSGLLGTLSVNLPVDVTPNDAKQLYVLQDVIVLRNSPRS